MCRRPTLGRASGTEVRAVRIILMSCVVVALCFSMTAIAAAAQADPVDSDARNKMGVGDGSGDRPGEDGGLQTLNKDEQTGNVTGIIFNKDEGRLGGADVRLVNTSTNTVESTTVSDSDGSYSFRSVEPGAYRLEAEFDGGEGSVGVTVKGGTTRNRNVELRLRRAFFSVSVEGTNSPVTEGEEVRIDVTITNAGEESGSQAVVLEVPGLGSDAEPVSLNGGSSTTVTLRLPTDLGDTSNYTAEVSTNDGTEETDFVVEERQTGIGVSILDTNSPVTEGEALTVEARVSNTGERSVSGTVTAEIAGLDSDTRRFSLVGGAEETKSFRIPTETGDVGEHTITVSVGDRDADSTNVTVEGETEDDAETNETEATDGASASVPEVKVTEEADEFVRFTLTEDSDLEEAYLTFEPEGWESARVVGGLYEGASVTVRTEVAAERLLESEVVFVPGGLSAGSDGSIDSRDATGVDQVTCLYDHGGYTFGGLTVPGEVDLPCHTPVLGEAPEVNEGSGTPISLEEGEYRLVGRVDGEKTVLRSYTVEAVEGDTNESETEDTDAGTDTGGGEESEETDGSGGGGDDTIDLPISLRDAARYLGIGAAALVGFAAFVAFSVFVVRRLKGTDWGGRWSDGGNGHERIVLDTDSKNDIYRSWRGMVERAGVEDVRTKTPSEIAEKAKEAGLDPEAVDELTDVFEEVRYRDAEPTAEQEERARRAFERIERSDGTE